MVRCSRSRDRQVDRRSGPEKETMDLKKAKAKIENCMQAVSSVVRLPDDVLRTVMVPVFGSGHGLIQGEIGTAKTSTVKALSRVLGLDHKRIDCTPDLFPSDIVGGEVLVPGGSVQFVKGPALESQLCQVEEPNRANPKTQSAFISIMEEKTFHHRGRQYRCMEPFIVLATQNPRESVGVFPLPEAQLDRFMTLILFRYPDRAAQKMIIQEYPTAGHMSEKIAALQPILSRTEVVAIRRLVDGVQVGGYEDRICTVCEATRPRPGSDSVASRFGRWGAGPRGIRDLAQTARTLALIDGSPVVQRQHVEEALPLALGHRVSLNREGQRRYRGSEDGYLKDILKENPIRP